MGINQSRGTEQTNLTIDHPKFLNSSIIKVKNNEFLRTKFSNDEKSYKAWKELLSKANIDHQFLLLPRTEKFQASGICANTGTLRIDFNNHPYLLTEEIYNRKGKKSYFHQTQLWYLLYALISAKKHLTDANANNDSFALIGDIRPSNVFINEHGQVRVANLYSWPNEKVNYQKTFQGINTYLSPEDMDQLHLGLMDNKKNIYSELFSIGLTMVSVGILKDCTDIYDIENFKFNFYEATKRINAFKCSSLYSQLLRSIIGNLCSYEPQKRLLLQQIWSWITKYERRIMTKQPFMIQEVPSYINTEINTLRSQLANIKQNQDINGSVKTIKSKKSQLLNFKSTQKSKIQFNSPSQLSSLKNQNNNGGLDLVVRTLRSPQAKQLYDFQRRVLIKSPQGFYQPKNIQKNGNKFKVFFQYKSPTKQFQEVHKAETTYEKKKQSQILKNKEQRPSSRQNRFIEQTKREEINKKNSPILKINDQYIVKQAISELIISNKDQPRQKQAQKLNFINSNIQQIISENVIDQKHIQKIVVQKNTQKQIHQVKKQNNEYNDFQISFESPPTAAQDLLLQGAKNQQYNNQYFQQIRNVKQTEKTVKQNTQSDLIQKQEERVRQQIQKQLVLRLQKEQFEKNTLANIKQNLQNRFQNKQILIIDQPQYQHQSYNQNHQPKYQDQNIVEFNQKPIRQNQLNQLKEQVNYENYQENAQILNENYQPIQNHANQSLEAVKNNSQRQFIPLGPQPIRQYQTTHQVSSTSILKQNMQNSQEAHQIIEGTQELEQQNVKISTYQKSSVERPLVSLGPQESYQQSINQYQEGNNGQQSTARVVQNYQSIEKNKNKDQKYKIDNIQDSQHVNISYHNSGLAQVSERHFIPLGPQQSQHNQLEHNQLDNNQFEHNQPLDQLYDQKNKEIILTNFKNSHLQQLENKIQKQSSEIIKHQNQNEQEIHISTYQKSPIDVSDRPLVSIGPEQIQYSTNKINNQNSQDNQKLQKLQNNLKSQLQQVLQQKKQQVNQQNAHVNGLHDIMQNIKSNLNEKIQKLKDQEKKNQQEAQNFTEHNVKEKVQFFAVQNQDNVQVTQKITPQQQNQINVILVDSFQSSFQNANKENTTVIQYQENNQQNENTKSQAQHNQKSLTQHIQGIINEFIQTQAMQSNQEGHKSENKEPEVIDLHNFTKNVIVQNSQIHEAKLQGNKIEENMTEAVDHQYVQPLIQVLNYNMEKIQNKRQVKDDFLQNIKEMNEQINNQKQKNIQVSKGEQTEEIKQSQVKFTVMKQIIGVSKQIKIQQSQSLQNRSDALPQFSNEAQLSRQIKQKNTINRSSIPMDSEFGNISEIMDINRQFGDTLDAKSDMNFLATIRRNEEHNEMIEQLIGKNQLQNKEKIIISADDQARLNSVVQKLVQNKQDTMKGQGKTIDQHLIEGLISNNNNIAALMTTTPIYDQSKVQIIYSERKTQNKTQNNQIQKEKQNHHDIIQQIKQINRQITQKHEGQPIQFDKNPQVLRAASMSENPTIQVFKNNKVNKFQSIQINEGSSQSAQNIIASNRADYSQSPFDVIDQVTQINKQEYNQVKSDQVLTNQHKNVNYSHAKAGADDEKLNNSTQGNQKLKLSLKKQHKFDIIDEVMEVNQILKKQTEKEDEQQQK